MSDVADRLAATLPGILCAPVGRSMRPLSEIVAALLPVVDAIAEERVEEALGEALGISTTRSWLEAVAWMARRHATALRSVR